MNEPRSAINLKQLIGPRFLLSFAAAFFLFAAGCYFFPRPLIRESLPFLTLPISIIHPNFQTQTGMEGRNVIYLEAVTMEKKDLGSREQLIRSTFKIRHDIGTIFGIPMIFFPLLLTWPGIPPLYRIKTALVALPILLLMIMSDLSLTLVLEIEKRLAVSTMGTNLLSFIAQALNAGGRQFLGLVLFGAAIAPLYLKKPAPVPAAALERNSLCPCGSGKKYKNCCMR